MSILLNILVSAVGCFIAILVVIFGVCIYDCICEGKNNKRKDYWDF